MTFDPAAVPASKRELAVLSYEVALALQNVAKAILAAGIVRGDVFDLTDEIEEAAGKLTAYAQQLITPPEGE